ncbi:MAG: Flp pilus assembly protein CpaB [Candidatus Wallbacteria bacterium]|nr:Flp pilus assembly protein CpaB [Candidatus Wallbacteria bacterium]
MNRNMMIVLMLVAGALGFLFFQNQRERERQRVAEEEERRKKIELQLRQAQEGKVTVLRANVALPANTRVPDTAIRSETISKDFAPRDAILKVEDVVDKFTTEQIPKDDIVNRNRLTDAARTLESFLQEGERFYSIRVDGVNAVSGFIKQGDHVDIVAILTYGGIQVCRTVLSNLEIFSVNAYKWEISAEDKKKGDLGNMTVTFRLNGDQASRLIQLIQLGIQPRFMLRPPSDIDPTLTYGWTVEHIVNDEDPSRPRGPQMPVRKEGEPPPMVAIEVIRHITVSQETFPLTTPEAEVYDANKAPLPAKSDLPAPLGTGGGAGAPRTLPSPTRSDSPVQGVTPGR